MTPSRNASCIRVLPAIMWLRSYERDRLGSDIVADVTLARISAFRSVERCVFCETLILRAPAEIVPHSTVQTKARSKVKLLLPQSAVDA
jgi:hypothetical protein